MNFQAIYLNTLKVFFPHHCIICLKNGHIICSKCFNRVIIKIPVQLCFVCDTEVRHGLIHQDCLGQNYLDGLIFVSLYDKPIKKIIKAAKYKGLYSYMWDLGEVMAQYFTNYKLKLDVVTSVPMYFKKQRLRGFNQAEVLAQAFCKSSGLNYSELLTRVRETKSQVGNDSEHRSINLKSAFKVNDPVYVTNKNILLVDDVFTTGSTLNESARTLKEQGAKSVVGFCFAKAGIRAKSVLD